MLALEMFALDYEKADSLLRYGADARALHVYGRGAFTYALDPLVLQFVGSVAYLIF